jgi:hypothetical protein
MNVGIEKAAGTPLISLAPRSLIVESDITYISSLTRLNANIPILSKFETKCLMVQIAYMESKNDPTLVVGSNYGKYQVSNYILEKYNYKDSTGVWTGLDGIDTEALFLDSPKVQDKIMAQFFEENYTKLIRTKAIRENDTKEIIAGMLSVAYQFQDAENQTIIKLEKISNDVLASIANEANSNYTAMKTKIWREYGLEIDSKGRPGGIYYNAGKYAIQNLAADVIETG